MNAELLAASALERWIARRRRGVVRAAVQRSAVPCAVRASAPLRCQRSAALDAAVDQDRRLPRGLRLLPAIGALSNRRRRRRRCCRSRGAGCRPRGEGQRRNALLHGCGMARPEAARPRTRDRNGRAVRGLGMETCATLGMLKDGPGRAAERRRARLLQPQSRHRAGVLRRDHPHAHPAGSAGHAGAGARRRASTSAAAASSAWANRARSARA